MEKKNRVSGLGKRMKGYEAVTDISLIKRMPVVIRLDGVAFHTLTKEFKKPFDGILMGVMQKTMQSLCKEIEGVVLGYTQSDEITLVLVDYADYDTHSWYNNRLQKICSVSASKASRYFNKYLKESVAEAYELGVITGVNYTVYEKQFDKADFDSRVWNLTREEVCNNLIWRQTDAETNSVLSLAQSLYKHNELDKLSCKALQDKMFVEKGINWSELSTVEKRGCACVYVKGSGWVIDTKMPILKKNREYVEKLLQSDEEASAN